MPNYDINSISSILAHARKLEGRTLAYFGDPASFKMPKGSAKGGFGLLVELVHFGLEANNESRPDFEKVGLELKTTPLVKGAKGVRVKERLVLNMIDFNKIVGEKWESSSFLRKNSRLLLIFYWHNDDEGPWEHKFELTGKWELPEEDSLIIKQDWESIVAKVREGKAHELSEGDTFLLGACTKGKDSTQVRPQPGSDIEAKSRAFSFKARYLKTIYDRLRGAKSEELSSIVSAHELRKKPLEAIIRGRFAPFIGMTFEDICKRLKITPSGKGRFDAVSRAIIGAKGKKVAEFENAEVIMRTIRLKPNGIPKEDISFPYFAYRDLVNERWETSTLRDQLQKKFFFVIYRITDGGLVLEKVMFWNMPYRDLEGGSKKAWSETIALINKDLCDELPLKSAGYPIHVRPHARDSNDVVVGLYKKKYVKKSFWLTGSYLAPFFS